MKPNEEILKYYSGLLTDEEKKSFEEKLSVSPRMKEEFDKTGEIINRLKEYSAADADESYFANLLPRVREKIDRQRGKVVFGKIAYALSISLAAALLLIFSFVNTPVNSSTDYVLEQEEVIKNIVADYLASGYSEEDYTIDIQPESIEDQELVDYLLTDDNLLTELYIDTDLLFNEK
ncbi:hypothetical protein ACSSWA_01635 [Melioribacter sp. Ez-97]|uniref:hypothetical protein n=1 Tax=Melioribacter sp. Ez-97 TaxID=3423434 RepID=UPI003ED9ED05